MNTGQLNHRYNEFNGCFQYPTKQVEEAKKQIIRQDLQDYQDFSWLKT